MYTAFYGLREKPFSLTPNPRFLFLAESHREALAHLLYGLEQGEGFIVVSGEVGTGKTTICRTLLERLGVETELAFLFNPSGTADEMLQSVNEEFGLPATGLSRRELLSQLNRFLLDKNRESKRVVLIIDEAQNLSTTTLEQVRLLSNLETTTSKLIQIILLGQPELGEKLDSEELRQLRQRIGVRWQLCPLSQAETGQYVRHRLRVAAGADRSALFSDGALAEVHKRTGGVPRLVNVLCDRALLAGYAAEAAQIDAELVKQAAREIRDLQGEAFGSKGRRRRARHAWWLAPLAAVLAALAVGAGLWLGRGDGGRAIRSLIDGVGSEGPPAVSAPAAPARTARSSELPPVSARPPGAETSAPRAGRDPASALRGDAVAIQTGHDASSAAVFDAEWQASRDARGPRPEAPANGFPGSEADALRDDAGDGSFLAHLLAEVPASTTRALAVTEILHVWGKPAEGVSGATEALALARLRDAGLAVHTVLASSLEELALLDHPALIEVRDGEGETHWLALVELRPSVAFVGGVVDRGPIGVSHEALEGHFEGRAYVAWSPGFELLGAPMLSAGSQGMPVRWVQQALVELGYLSAVAAVPDDGSAVYDAATRRGIERFQRAQGLRQDGITGPITLMRLGDALGRNARPHLRAGGAG